MTTKERIVDEALTLFSTKGFKGTSVKNIADAVGIKDSSLYKHFTSKQEILDSIVKTIGNRISDMSIAFGIPPGNDLKKSVQIYAGFDEATLVGFSRRIFLFYLKDSYISRFWRMGNIEQYNNPAVYALFSKLFLEDSINYQTALFGELVREGIFIEADPDVIAMGFYSPIYFLLSKYSTRPEDEAEALDAVDQQVREFYRVYRRKDKK